MHWNGRIYESHIIRELVETYANYLTNIHNIDSLSAYKFIDEIVMTLIDYIISNPHGGKAVSAGAWWGNPLCGAGWGFAERSPKEETPSKRSP